MHLPRSILKSDRVNGGESSAQWDLPAARSGPQRVVYLIQYQPRSCDTYSYAALS